MSLERTVSLPYFTWSPNSLRGYLILLLFGVLSLEFLLFSPSPGVLIAILSWVVVYLVAYRKMDYLDPFVAYAMPWMAILMFSVTPLSEYAVPVNQATYQLIFLALLSGLLVSGQRLTLSNQIVRWKKANPSLLPSKLGIFLLDSAFFSLTALNVVIAGYIPLIRGITTGDSGYLEFGVHGLYGFYLAFANAWGILHLVLYFRTGKFKYLARYLFLFLVFISFVTRQNLLSLAIEGVIVFSLLRKRFNLGKVVLWLAVAGILFSVMGAFRSGNIKSLAKVRPEFMWVPDPVVWLYSYSYFNIANVNNLVLHSSAPYYDGSSVAQLVPSFLRPAYESTSYLEVEIFNVSSYLYPVYGDLGIPGVILLTSVAMWFTNRQRTALFQEASLFRLGTFVTLYFCAAFSFFVNFWFYLPIIFQIVFFKLLSNLAEQTVEASCRREH